MVMAGMKKKIQFSLTLSKVWQIQAKVSDCFSLMRYVCTFPHCKPGHDGKLMSLYTLAHRRTKAPNR